MKIFSPISFLFICIVTWCCNTNSISTNKLQLNFPSHFPEPIPAPSRNETSLNGVALGKTLFFDTGLSANGQIACATCHQPKLAFSDSQKFSTGHSGITLKRNTPPLFNLAWSTTLFWDGGVKNLESLSFAALMNPDEMGVDLKQLCQKLNQNEYYLKQFKNTFEIGTISSAYISRALAQYMRTIISADAKYDSVQLELISFSDLEAKGKKVFDKNCASCHTPPLFADNEFHHNGLTQSYSSNNLSLSTGRFRISRDSLDLGKYKTPSLRNLSVTAPYMHDGRFETIDEVLDHYQNQDILNQNQDSLVRFINFSNSEKAELKAFLKTLNGSIVK